MIPITSLLLPIIVSAFVVFIVSSILHMLFTYHNNDFRKIPSEDNIMNDLSKFDLPPGDYVMPFAKDNRERNSQEFKDKLNKGPVALLTVYPKGQPGMGQSLMLWFIYSILVGIFSAYVAGRALEPGAHYLSVFRFAGVTAFAGYSLALLQNSIWFRKSWSATLKSVFDGLLYALVTAGVFGWLWPSV